MFREVFIKGSIEAGIGAGAAVAIGAFVLGNSGILPHAIAAGIGAIVGNLVRVFVLKRT